MGAFWTKDHAHPQTKDPQTKDPNDISLSLSGLYGYQNVVIHTAQVLGSGAYGNVVKATLDENTCAAKMIHRVMVDSQDPGFSDFISRFEQECQILRDLKHPNIVQFLGVVKDPSTSKPILLMELMKDSLTHFLESSPTNIPYHVQVNISHDITLAVAHLHRNGILHRDLSSNNILLSTSHQAKVTDFGMSKIAASNPSTTRSKVTQCPGTLVYMPPEALRPQPRYSDKIDTFSIGVLLLQIVTRKFPAPSDAFVVKEDPNSPAGVIYVPLPECERRKSDISKVPILHGLLPVIIECLKQKSKDRPTSPQMCFSLEQIKNTATYKKSLNTPSFMIQNTDEVVQQLIDHAMESGSIPQRNVVGVITGLMGAGKTTLLYHLFGMAPPDLYTSTGVAEQEFRGLLHHIMHLSAGTWQRISYKDIREFLAPLIRAGMKESDIDSLASKLLHAASQRFGVHENPLPLASSSITASTASTMEPVFPKSKVYSSPQKPPSTQMRESPSCKEMVPLVKAAETDHEKDLVLELVHMIDTGGQPELMEVMPSLIHNANLALVLVDLRYGINEHPRVDYHEQGVPYKRYSQSHYTTSDIILKLVSTLHAKKSLNEPFRLLVIATHRDCVQGNLDRKVEALNSELSGILLPEFKTELILSKTPDKIAFVLNLQSPDDSDIKTLGVIRTEIAKPGLGQTLKTPISFFVFEQDLLKFADTVAKRDILSLDECRQVGVQLQMSHEMVEAALVHFHTQNTFLYFRHILPNHVFVKPQVPLDMINEIVHYRYKVNAGELNSFPAKLAMQLNEGIISDELLTYDEIFSHFKKGLYEVQDAIKLFCHTLTLAPMKPDTAERRATPSDKQNKYLMMCLLPAIPDHELHHYIPECSDTVPLVVKFSSGCVPLGCFGSTISCLLSQYGLEVVREVECGPPKCLASNIALLYNPDLLLYVILVDYKNHIKIHVYSDLSFEDLPQNACNKLLTTVFGAIEKVFEIMKLDTEQIKITPAVVCSCQTKNHFASFKKIEGRYYLQCSTKASLPDDKQLLWIGNDTDNFKPNLPQMMRLKLPEKIGTKYEKFGILLLEDTTGCLVTNVIETYHHQPERIVTSILRTWLQEEPTPVTWENLIKVLRDSELNALAEYVKKSHKIFLNI